MEPKDWISLFAALVALSGLGFAIWQYLKQKRRDFKKVFFEHQLAIYKEAVDSAARIVTLHKEDEDYYKSLKTFYRLYHGKMCIVEDLQVEKRMVQFYTLLEVYEDPDFFDYRDDIRMELSTVAMALSHACRNSALTTWGVEKELEGYFTDYSGYTLESVQQFIDDLYLLNAEDDGTELPPLREE